MIQTEEKLREIKRSFRLYMNGEVAQSLRDKGLAYHVIWGVSNNHLKIMAAKYGEDFALASALWKENIRECRILATMIMPPAQMDKELAVEWMGSLKTTEEAELCAFNLFRKLPFALDLAVEWICNDNELCRICSYNILSRLLLQMTCCDDNLVNVMSMALKSDLTSTRAGLRQAAYNCLLRFMDVNDKCEGIGEELINSLEHAPIG
jgi:hypothetical protein